MPKVIKPEDVLNLKLRLKIIRGRMPRNYVSIVNHFYPDKYSKSQIREFVNNKTMNFSILEDLEKIFK